jgi:hypothetical protein
MLDRFREDLPDLKADLYLVDGKPTESPTPIVIEDANDRQRYRLLSVSTFLAIDVEDVMEKGANWGDPEAVARVKQRLGNNYTKVCEIFPDEQEQEAA